VARCCTGKEKEVVAAGPGRLAGERTAPGRKKPTEGAVGKDHFKRVERERKTDWNYRLHEYGMRRLLQLLTVAAVDDTAIYKSNGFTRTSALAALVTRRVRFRVYTGVTLLMRTQARAGKLQPGESWAPN
jgi:hypothetical protein